MLARGDVHVADLLRRGRHRVSHREQVGAPELVPLRLEHGRAIAVPRDHETLGDGLAVISPRPLSSERRDLSPSTRWGVREHALHVPCDRVGKRERVDEAFSLSARPERHRLPLSPSMIAEARRHVADQLHGNASLS